MQPYDVVIIGGGPAGLSAALLLGRSRRRVLICDSGSPRNAPATASHNFLTRDGTPPLQLLQLAREQLQPYATVEFESIAVTEAHSEAEMFAITLADGRNIATRKLLFATGLVDDLPPIPGIQDLWGKSIAQCPYCHGWEVRDTALAIIGNGPMLFEYARLISGWTHDLVICTNGPSNLTESQLKSLSANKIAVREEEIAELEGSDGQLEAIRFTNGERLSRHAIFMHVPQHQRSPLPQQLGCTINEKGLIQVDAMGATEIAGLYAVGDAAHPMQSIVVAAASGTIAAGRINHELAIANFDQIAAQSALVI